MEDKITLRQYFSYNKSLKNARILLIDLDKQLKYIHMLGFYVQNISSDYIIYDKHSNIFKFDINKLKYIGYDYDFDIYCTKNRVEFAKLSIGTFLTIEQGFCDYSSVQTSFFKDNFDLIEEYIPYENDKDYYYREMFINNNKKAYYSDYILKLDFSNKKKESNKELKNYNYESLYYQLSESGHVNILYYIVIITLILVIGILTYTIFMII